MTGPAASAAARAPFLRIMRADHVAVLRMDRPEHRNTLSEDGLADEFESVTAQLSADLDIRAVVLTGSGAAFSAGGNVKTMLARNGPPSGLAAAVPDRYARGIQRVTKAMVGFDVPLIAAVNGPAMGAGLDLACMCDIRIAGRSAKFAESFIKLGLVPGDGGAWLLPRVIGEARAREMAFTGDSIDAETALRWGLISELVDDDQLMATALVLAHRVAVNPPRQIRFTKRLANAARGLSLDEALEMAALYQALAHHTGDHAEGVEALIAKRSPEFVGE